MATPRRTWAGLFWDGVVVLVLLPLFALFWLLDFLLQVANGHPWVPLNNRPCSDWLLSSPRYGEHEHGIAGPTIWLTFKVRDKRRPHFGGDLTIKRSECGVGGTFRNNYGKGAFSQESHTTVSIADDGQLMLTTTEGSRPLGRLDCTEAELAVVRGFLAQHTRPTTGGS